MSFFANCYRWNPIDEQKENISVHWIVSGAQVEILLIMSIYILLLPRLMMLSSTQMECSLKKTFPAIFCLFSDDQER